MPDIESICTTRDQVNNVYASASINEDGTLHSTFWKGWYNPVQEHVWACQRESSTASKYRDAGMQWLGAISARSFTAQLQGRK